MPIYEYVCPACGHRFEALVFGGRTPECPECGAPEPRKQFSVFGVGASGGSPSSCPASSGGG